MRKVIDPELESFGKRWVAARLGGNDGLREVGKRVARSHDELLVKPKKEPMNFSIGAFPPDTA
jgi:hypothetical protein